MLTLQDVYPSLVFSSAKAHEAKDVCAKFEDLTIDVVDIIEGVAVLIHIYWVFNIQYSKTNKNTFALFEHFCGLNSTTKSPLLLRLISEIEKLPERLE